ncbi:MAG: hypothetical protein AAF431_19155 [Pseudomonadota bacterium]
MTVIDPMQILGQLQQELAHVLLFLFAINFAFIVLAIWQRHGLEKMHSKWLQILCVSMSAVLIWQGLGIAGQINTFQLENQGFMVTLFSWVSLLLFAVLAWLAPWVSMYFLKRTVKPYSQ